MFSISSRLTISRKCLFNSVFVPIIPGCVSLNKLINLIELPGLDDVCSNKFINTSAVETKFMQHKTQCQLPVKGHHVYNNQNRLISNSTPNLETAIGLWERDPKGKYAKKVATNEALRAGLKELKFELIKWKQEVRVAIAQDPLIVFPGDRDPVWVFTTQRRSSTSPGYDPNPSDEASPLNPITSLNTTPHNVAQSRSEFDGWMVSCDSDVNEGFSTAQLTTSPAGHGLFNGHLNTRIPKDGQIHYAGYCIMRSLRPAKSFGRRSFFDWGQYTHMVIRCRGDGRSYMINLAAAGYFDIAWNDMFSYVLYTRGGPHWQTYKVPFSRFLFSSKGTVQDKQSVLDPSKISSVGFAVGDKINAPFRLEIDYVGVENDPIHSEETAYEMYSFPQFFLTP